ncbi:PDZ domain-containing protein [Streptomyces ipomoeae]|nr:PDZ domain-containing protein [Streptomyces ipomoeae]
MAESSGSGDGVTKLLRAEAGNAEAPEGRSLPSAVEAPEGNSSASAETTARLGLERGNASADGVGSLPSGDVSASGEATTRLEKGVSAAGETTRPVGHEGAGFDTAGEGQDLGQGLGESGVPAAGVVPVADGRSAGGPGGAVSAPGAPSERPKPLHDPDPYGTPPYGEPGPWAPAPPVQHPATTPAHGTSAHAATPAHGAPSSGVPQAHGGPVPAVAPAHGAPSSGVPQAHGGPVPAVAPVHDVSNSAAPQAHGAPVPAVPPVHGAPSSGVPQAHGAPAAAVAPAHGAPNSAVSQAHGAPTAAPGVHTPGAPQAHSAPASTAAPTHAASASSAVPPSASVTPAHGTSVASTAHQPTAAPYTDAPSRPVSPYADAPSPAAAPYADASRPATAAQYPDAASQPPVAPQPTATPYPDPSQPSAAHYRDPSQPAPSSQPPYADASPAGPSAPGNPWQSYDPWAGSGPLQQNGAAVADVGRGRKRRGKVLLLGAVLLALVSGGIGGAVGARLERNGGVGEVELPQSSGGATGRAPDSVAGIAASALPSVVTLHVSGSDGQGTGTGFVLDERGHILTNNHVVDPAGTGGEISVTFSGGETATATLVGRDTGYDLAVVKVTGVSGLKPLPLGNSDDVRVGDPVVAIGAPFDLANTVTSGIISAKERPITAGGESGDASDVSYVDALQTDAPINPGNSGGPLVDVNARVIGINSAIRSADNGSGSDGGQAGSIGLGFAIPINQGKRVAEELINTGKATHPVIGVTLDRDYAGDGARIGNDSGGDAVTQGGPADKAGIRSGDVITKVDGQRIHSGDELIVKVRAHRPGDRLELTLQRGGREQKVTLSLGSSGGD